MLAKPCFFSSFISLEFENNVGKVETSFAFISDFYKYITNSLSKKLLEFFINYIYHMAS